MNSNRREFLSVAGASLLAGYAGLKGAKPRPRVIPSSAVAIVKAASYSDDLVKRMLAVDTQAAAMREQWAPKFRKVLTGKQTALFLQLDRRISQLIEIQVASVIPLVK